MHVSDLNTENPKVVIKSRLHFNKLLQALQMQLLAEQNLRVMHIRTIKKYLFVENDFKIYFLGICYQFVTYPTILIKIIS